MDQFHLMSVFVAVADEQGFAAGARKLGLSPPAVTRAVAALEKKLGVRLLQRTTRLVRPTDAGLRYLEDARRILNEVEAAGDAAAGINAEPRGHLSVTAPALFGRIFVLPTLVEYLELYPQTRMSSLFLDRVVNMMEEGVDVGVRIGELPDSSLRALRVGSVRLMLCAAPAYLARHGTPQSVAALRDHSIVASSAGSSHSATDWRFETNKGSQNIRVQPRLRVTTNDAAIEAARQGLGITRVLSYQVAPQLESGTLQALLTDCEPPPRPIHIVHREDRYSSAKVRTLVDLLARRLRAQPALNPD
ncbi:LysR family transcriptional regulator [Marinobacterium rhizophilum]|uniref:LysR family transcriptional regulator n=1 Tax=Marinobacterium rhizophilum TaxID=420402 RepID=A0ABY5HLI1_9GAMM|nr:LysR family transcriptional regulator [Marinobacterium rhizophilum]UTW12667.1 LysR family transcriptional regulator [Marinobacterium rhizophilum]